MKENDEYCVYVHINKYDGYKAYVGTTKNTKKRWRNGEGYKGQNKFYNAIKKYGWDKFNHIILAEGLTLEEAWKKEKEYIKKYDSINDGYNVHEGGQITLTAEMRKKGYITKQLKNSGVAIHNYLTGQVIRFDTVEQASKVTGISEHWFYRYYRREVDCLKELDIRFDIEYNSFSIHQEVVEKMNKEEEQKKLEEAKIKKEIEKQERIIKEKKHQEAIKMAKEIVYGKK